MPNYLQATPFFLLFGLNSLLLTILFVRQIALTVFVRYTRLSPDVPREAVGRWPTVTILIPAHNEELVIGDCLDAMSSLDYPPDLLTVIVINDRSTDRTRFIVEQKIGNDNRLRIHNREENAHPGKPAAIGDVIDRIDSEVVVFFDADYLPDAELLKFLVIPFINSMVGATMGRVVPYNTNTNLLTRLIDLERRAGYAVDQYARSILNLLPQFGGTVGGVRISALRQIGGWKSNILAEDTDLTYRLFLAGWRVEYLPHAMCYEESPETWRTRFKQVCRWAYGHNECALKYLVPILKSRKYGFVQRIDAAIVLLFYIYPTIAILSLFAALVYPVFFEYPPFNFAVLSIISFFVGFGNFAPYFQIAVALQRDCQEDVATLMPLIFVSSAVSMLASTYALFLIIKNAILGREFMWEKTLRFRRELR